MKIEFFCPRWGVENISWENFCMLVKVAGYDGIESAIPFHEAERSELTKVLNKNKLRLIGQLHQSFERNFEDHKISFKRHLTNIISMNPILIDSQTGKDYYSIDQNNDLFKMAKLITLETGILIAHETHRNKALYAAHVTAEILLQDPELRITADFSHWCNTSESLLEEQEEALNIAIDRSIHIHARIGHAQSPQVSDPRAPEWKVELDAHLRWWDAIVQSRLKSGVSLLTITPEFGPAPYMPLLPYTKMPVASQWDINIYMMQLLKNRYQHITNS
jgi:hypothetical protein